MLILMELFYSNAHLAWKQSVRLLRLDSQRLVWYCGSQSIFTLSNNVSLKILSPERRERPLIRNPKR